MYEYWLCDANVLVKYEYVGKDVPVPHYFLMNNNVEIMSDFYIEKIFEFCNAYKIHISFFDVLK